MLFDLHCHTKGMSPCARLSYKEEIDNAKSYGFSGIVLTNHYSVDFYKHTIGFDEWANKYVNEYYRAKKYGEKVGLRVLFGVELTMTLYPNVHILIYGITPEMMKKTPNLCTYTLPDLYKFCQDNEYVLVQAHPYRNGTTVLDTKYLDGLEINCHPAYHNTFSNELIEIAKKNHLLITCSNDYHANTYRPLGGTYIPNGVKTERDLANFFLSTKIIKLQIHEVNAEKTYKKEIDINKVK